MDVLKFKCQIITPMFLGGASPNGEAELRPPSIKGMLRWWFRALGGNREWEERIFGSTGKRSRLALRITDMPSFIAPLKKEFSGELAYLGYGPITWDRNSGTMKNTRAFLEANSDFELMMVINLSERDRKAVLLSLWALVHFGGLGSRNRRGWGSIKVVNYPKGEYLRWNFRNAQDFEKYLRIFFDQVQSVFGTFPNSLPEYTRISKKTKIIVNKREFNSYKSALEDIGSKMVNFRKRRYYRDIKRLMERAEKPDGLPRFLTPTGENSSYNTPVPKAIFGLPNNYMSRSRRGNRKKNIPPSYPWQVSVEAMLDNDSINRRSSPLLIKISKWDNGKYGWIVTYLPSKFLPDGAVLKLGFPKGGLPRESTSLIEIRNKLINKIIKANPPSYKLLEEFLNSLDSDKEVSL